MNLAGNRAKQLFKSLRTGQSPSIVGLWTAATAVDQIRKRSKRPNKELIVRKKLKPGQSYVIRMPGKGEDSLAGSLPAGTPVATVDAAGDGDSISSQLLGAATDLIAATSQPVDDSGPAPEPRRRRKAARTPDGEPDTGKVRRRRRRRRRARVADEETAAVEEGEESSLASTIVDVAASFLESADDPDDQPEVIPATAGRRRRRRTARLASLDDLEIDRESLSRRRRRKLDRTERRARKRPSRKRIRRARHQQKRAARASREPGTDSEPSPRRRRKIRAAERIVEHRRTRLEQRSTRRRRRKLKKAEKALGSLNS